MKNALIPVDNVRMMREGRNLWPVFFGFLLVSACLFGSPVDPSIPPDIMRDFELLAAQIKQNPNHVPTLNSLGIVYARAGQLAEATQLWERALALDPHYVHLFNNLGSAYKSLHKLDEARRIYQKGLALAPSYWLYYNLGLLEKEAGRPKEAQKYLLSCLQLNPQFDTAKNLLVELQQAAPKSPKAAYHSSYFGAEPKAPVDFAGAPEFPAPWDIPSGKSESGGNPDEPDEGEEKPEHPPALIPSRPLTTDDCATVFNRGGKVPAAEKLVALTFDDGPHPSLTPRLLNFLRSEGIAATFFVIGSRAEVYPDIISRMAAEGHEIGNHTWNHRSLASQDSGSALSSLRHTSSLVSSLSGHPCRLVRPPFGHTNSRVLGMIQSQGWHQIMWDVDTRDWQSSSENRIVGKVLRQFAPGSIVLFHDIHPGALHSLPTLVRAWKKCGYRFVTVSQLLGIINAAS